MSDRRIHPSRHKSTQSTDDNSNNSKMPTQALTTIDNNLTQQIFPTEVTSATIRNFYRKTSSTINGSNQTATIAPKIT
jgi:hypothetical protein